MRKIVSVMLVCATSRYGRKVALLSFHAVKVAGGVLSIYAPTYELFTLSRFIIAVGSTAANLAMLLIGTASSPLYVMLV